MKTSDRLHVTEITDLFGNPIGYRISLAISRLTAAKITFFRRNCSKSESCRTSPIRFAAAFFAAAFFCAACASRERGVIYQPPPETMREREQIFIRSEIQESQNGGAEAAIPEWVNCFLRGGIAEVEAMEQYQGKYIFIGENRGSHFNALKQWARYFSVEQDLPRLAAARIEKRLLSAASLYPDDEYGAFFEAAIKSAYNREYPGAVKEETFWIKKKTSAPESEQVENLFSEPPYNFFVLVSADKVVIQNQIRDIIESTAASVSSTRDQASAINWIHHNFFEGF